MNCPLCGKTIDDSSRFCGYCGKTLPRCPSCGKVLKGPSRFCPADGTPIPEEINALFAAEPRETPVTSAPGKMKLPTNKAVVILLTFLGVAVLTLVILLGLRFTGGTDDLPQGGIPLVQSTLPVQTTQAPAILMPDCVGEQQAAVENLFSGIPYAPRYEYAFDENVAKDLVISQSIPAGVELNQYSDIVIVVSKGADQAPEGYNQKVIVTAAPGSSYGILTLNAWQDGQWKELFRCDATVGYNGISTDYYEGSKRTPLGVFKLGIALSANSIPNNNWPFRLVSSNTCIVDDVNSRYYNTIQSINSLPYGTHYDAIGNKLVKGYSNICIYIEHNGNGLDSNNVVPGKCSVITICGQASSISPTAGCVDISSSDMLRLISLLDYSKDPHIEIGLR